MTKQDRPDSTPPEGFDDLKYEEPTQSSRYGPIEHDTDTTQEKIHRNMGRLEGRMDALENTQDQVIRRFENHLDHINDRLDYMSRSWLFGYAAWKIVLLAVTLIGAILGAGMWGMTEYREWTTYNETEQREERSTEAPATPGNLEEPGDMLGNNP